MFLKAAFNADSDGLAGDSALAGDATLALLPSKEAKEGNANISRENVNQTLSISSFSLRLFLILCCF